ncbi:MAG: sodium:calcium antiporter [Chloroflexota bacterium]|nr:sodium:calcium antiporter [Chloroflexota bacterium]
MSLRSASEDQARAHAGEQDGAPGHAMPSAAPAGTGRAGWIWIAVAMATSFPWLAVRVLLDWHQLPPLAVAALTGLGILGAAFILSWAAEAFQMDVSQALALALLSLIAVLPEYAVDVVFAWKAGLNPEDPTLASYAVANMTGSNRLLIGVGWSSVVLLAWWRARRRSRGRPVGSPDDPTETSGGAVTLERGQALEIGALALATLYSFIIPLKGGLSLVDTVVLVSLFGVYAWGTSRVPAEHPELVGPALVIGALPPARRRTVTYGLFLFAAAVIFVSAEPFAEGLVETGTAFGIDEFLLVQWLAPFASESPEFLVALLFAWRGMAGAGLRTLVASKVNQWTLLIGTLAVAYSLARGGMYALPLDGRQVEELLLTSAQSLFALVLIANFDLSVKEALVLLGTFLVQLVFPDPQVRIWMAGAYMLMSVLILARSPARRAMIMQIPAMIRESIGSPQKDAVATSSPARGS